MTYTTRIMCFPGKLRSIAALSLVCLAVTAVMAQSGIGVTVGSTAKAEAPPPPGGTVSGRVVFADSNGPARFSKVLLKSSTPSEPGDNPFAALMEAAAADAKSGGKAGAAAKPKLSAAEEGEKKQSLAAANRAMSSIADLMVSTTVGADGSYVFTNVKAGTYYVHAIAAGYIDPLSQFSPDDLTSSDPVVRQKIAAVATIVHVSGTDSSRADLRLERGASISGRVLYDDGTPAVGWIVRTVHQAPAGSAATPAAFSSMGVDMADLDLSHITEMSQTDDMGHFRLSGLATGEYVLQARFTAPSLGHSSFNPLAGNGMADMQGLKLTVFSGDALRRKDAKTVSVRSGDERSGYDLTVPLHVLHSVAGSVRAHSDGHAVNSGTVELSLQDADGKPDASVHLAASIQRDGSFHFDYVPSGTYEIKTAHAGDVTTLSVTKMFGSQIADQKTNHSYGPATRSIVLADGDLTDLKLEVPEVAVAN